MAACPFLIEGVLHTTLKSLFQGVHYYRYPDSFPAVLWASDIAAAALPHSVIFPKREHWETTSSNTLREGLQGSS